MRTPGPFTLRERSEGGVISLIEKDIAIKDWPIVVVAPSPPFAFGKTIALCTSKIVAKQIVRACNAHDALVEALEDAYDYLQFGGYKTEEEYADLISICRKALALAKGNEWELYT